MTDQLAGEKPAQFELGNMSHGGDNAAKAATILSDFSFDSAKSGLLSTVQPEPLIAGGTGALVGAGLGYGALRVWQVAEATTIGIATLPTAVMFGFIGGGEGAVNSIAASRAMMAEATVMTASKLAVPLMVGIGVGAAIGTGAYYGYKWLTDDKNKSA